MELRDRIAKDGIAGVSIMEYSPEKKQACIEGFNLLQTVTDMPGLQALLNLRHAVEHELLVAKALKERRNYRNATIQLEWACDVFRIAYRTFPQGGRALMYYASVVGVNWTEGAVSKN